MTMGDSGANSIMDFVQRYRDYEGRRDSTHELIKDLMIYAERVESANNHLALQVTGLTMDLEDATKSRRLLQHHLQDVEERMGSVSLDNNQLKNRNPYVLLLIDGDGLIFHQHFIRQGAEGGRRASTELHQAVATDPLIRADGAEIFVKIIANVGSLNRALRRDGTLSAENELEDFIAGFNQAKFFDFVDVGASKVRAITKLKENALFHIKNNSCKQIIMGISHDPVYGPILDEIVRGDASKRERTKVLEGYPTIHSIASIGADIIRFQEIFRSDKLTDKRTVSSHSIQSVQSGSSISTSTSGLPNLSYATITQKASPPPQITLPIPLAPKTTNSSLRVVKQPPKPAWNPGPRGLDAPIPLNPLALETIKKRKDNNKLCNNHFLRGPCAKGDDCCFVHEYSPNKDEKNAIAFLARLNPCTNGQDCDVNNCIYGHHCPSVVNGICTHPFCKFRIDEHPPGTKLRNTKA
ncbi:putative c-x8-c-x5-c-x3-h zinc finger protein [Rosellinia necatrix]|uniref:Putative c-x8-c-x5-c-x3-h zinc finger protein n=1 Tax=Rosellinia necatrix TaxID=77044 RepID=A0A1W2TW43_ROSNE|nr:putative c-x8-c-x5-c-x3-h zinc finger protein [Rosellinia necatrix]